MSKIPIAHRDSKNAFITWDDSQSFAKASTEINKAYNAIEPIHRSVGSIANRFQNIDGTTSVRDSYTRMDYEFFRPGEQIPKRFRDIMLACNGAYQKVGIVRQVVDLMGDFASQGIRLVHPNQSVERFYQEWFKQISGEERSERFLNYLYRMGNVVIKRSNGIIPPKVANNWKKSVAQEDLIFKEEFSTSKMEIPLRYTFLNPLVLEVIGEEIAAFTGKVRYALKLPVNFYRSLNLPLHSFDPAILTEELPRDIQGALNNNDRYLLLDPAKIITCFYKKDDWDVWAYPMLYSLLDDLILFEKMKLADLTALDGVISHIRIWKLGSLEHKIFPTDAAIRKLASVLLNHTAGGAMDLIWGPDLTVEETKTDVYKFLGGEKYEGVTAHIHAGLGVPSSISGAKGGTFSEGFLSLKTLVERLKYGRRILTLFWENEIKIVQEAMGFRYPAQVIFDNMNMHDESAEKALWIQLVDRDIVSIESVQEKFGQIPEIENIRLKRQYNKIENNTAPPKVSPYHDAQPNLSLEKIALQRGLVTPTEVGLELDPKKRGEKTMVEMQQEQVKMKGEQPSAKPVGVSGQGRPKNSKDKKERKSRGTKPRSVAEVLPELVLYANKLQKIIASEINPFFLEKFNKKNMRQLTTAEERELEDFKFWLLYNIEPYSVASKEDLIKVLGKPILVYHNIKALYDQMIVEFKDSYHTDPTYSDLDHIRSLIYGTFMGEFNENL